MLSDVSEFPTRHFFLQFTISKQISDMLGDCASGSSKKFGNLSLRKPNIITLKTNIDSDVAANVLIEEETAGGGLRSLCHLIILFFR
jgi:hypothetical protein